ncbi:MAG: hypothetical protein J4F28_02235 [Nitrosopumilaceae archaeon]|nr:hypothetical protein [Nitrosopumilaceae archaeon]
MKRTNHTIGQVYTTAHHYSRLLAVPMPHLMFRPKDILGLPRHITKGRRSSIYRYFGVCYRRHRIIYLAVGKFDTIGDLRRTIAHELVHLRFPYLRHGTRFETIIDRVINGEQFKAYKKPIPDWWDCPDCKGWHPPWLAAERKEVSARA